MVNLSEMNKVARPVGDILGAGVSGAGSFVSRYPIQTALGAAGALIAGSIIAKNIGSLIDLYYKHNSLKAERQQNSNLGQIISVLKSPKATEKKEQALEPKLIPPRLT